MRRAILALTGMVAGTTLLISLKSAPGANRLPAQVAADEAAAARAAALASASPGAAVPGSPGPDGAVPGAPANGSPALPGPSSGAQPGAQSGAQPGQQPGGQSAGAGTAGQPQGQQQPRTATTTKPPAAPPPATAGSFTGDSSYTEFGYVTVAITVSGGKITEVTAVELPSNEPRSVSISAKAGPTLRQRALAAQSSTIDSVSGATYTSDGYKASLQSALDKAGLG